MHMISCAFCRVESYLQRTLKIVEKCFVEVYVWWRWPHLAQLRGMLGHQWWEAEEGAVCHSRVARPHEKPVWNQTLSKVTNIWDGLHMKSHLSKPLPLPHSEANTFTCGFISQLHTVIICNLCHCMPLLGQIPQPSELYRLVDSQHMATQVCMKLF